MVFDVGIYVVSEAIKLLLNLDQLDEFDKWLVAGVVATSYLTYIVAIILELLYRATKRRNWW